MRCATALVVTLLLAYASTNRAFAQAPSPELVDAGPAGELAAPDAAAAAPTAAPDSAVDAGTEPFELMPSETASAIELDAATPDVPTIIPASNAAVDEIIVTAQRRKTNLQQTPIAITAVSSEELRERGAVDLRGVAESTPNLQLVTSTNASGGSSFAQAFIRGVGQSDFYTTKDPAVGIYIDGVYVARAPGALLELLDIERIEVLRGPKARCSARTPRAARSR